MAAVDFQRVLQSPLPEEEMQRRYHHPKFMNWSPTQALQSPVEPPLLNLNPDSVARTHAASLQALVQRALIQHQQLSQPKPQRPVVRWSPPEKITGSCHSIGVPSELSAYVADLRRGIKACKTQIEWLKLQPRTREVCEKIQGLVGKLDKSEKALAISEVELKRYLDQSFTYIYQMNGYQKTVMMEDVPS